MRTAAAPSQISGFQGRRDEINVLERMASFSKGITNALVSLPLWQSPVTKVTYKSLFGHVVLEGRSLSWQAACEFTSWGGNRKQGEQTGNGWRLWNLRIHPQQWCISSNKATPLEPPKELPKGGQMFKCLKVMEDSFHSNHCDNYLYNSLVGSTLFCKIYYYFYLHVSVYVLPKCRCLQRPDRGIQFLGAGVRGGCELPYAGSGNLEIKLMPSTTASNAFNSSATSPVQLATFYFFLKIAMKAS